MKKAFLSLILISLLAATMVPAIVLAQPATSCTLRHVIQLGDEMYSAGTTMSESTTNAWGMFCMLDAVYTVIDWIFFGLIALVALFTILGAFDILTAAGDPEKVSKGRGRIMYAMIGLAVALLSKAVPSVVKALINTP